MNLNTNLNTRYLIMVLESKPVASGISPFNKSNWIIIILCTLVCIDDNFAANKFDTFKPYAASNLLFDSNFFRLPDNTDPSQNAGNTDGSEFIKQISAGLDMDWKINRQQLIGGVNFNQNWFQNFSNLDYLGWNTFSQWNWQLGNHFDGEIGYSKKIFLGDYSQLNRYTPNMQENQRFFANAGYLFHANGKFTLGIFRNERQFDDPSRQVSNSLEDNIEFNIQYLSPDQSNLGIRTVLTKGQYPNRSFDPSGFLDDGYQRFNYGLTWDWNYSAITQIDGMVGYLYQRNNHLSSRDFGDAIARLNIHWQATDKTLIDLLLKREINQANNLTTNFYLLQGIEIKTQWQLSPKLTLKLPMSVLNQEFFGESDGDEVGTKFEKNNVYSLGVHLIYHPLENISVNSVFNYETRDSNYENRAYDSQLAGLSLQAVF